MVDHSDLEAMLITTYGAATTPTDTQVDALCAQAETIFEGAHGSDADATDERHNTIIKMIAIRMLRLKELHESQYFGSAGPYSREPSTTIITPEIQALISGLRTCFQYITNQDDR